MNSRMLAVVLGVALAGAVHPVAADSRTDRAKDQQKLMKQLVKEKDPEARALAAQQLGEMGGTEAVDALAAALKDRSAEVRVAAAGALVALKDAAKGAVPPLKEALHDTEGLVRFNAMVALYNMNEATPAELAPVLTPFLRDAEASTRRESLKILMVLGVDHDEVRAALLDALAQAQPNVRLAVLEALAKETCTQSSGGSCTIKGSESWIKEVAVGEASKDSDPAVRTAAQALVASITALQASPGYSACRLLTREEAAAMLGGNPRQSVVGRGCTYDVPGGSMRLVIRPEPFDKNGPREVEDRYKTGDGETENAELRRTGGLKGAAAAGLTGPGFFLKTIRKPAMKAEGLSIQDEPSFEKGSFSARKREAIDLQLAVKSFVLVVGVRDESKEIPAAMLDKLRDIAKKAASRL